MITPPGTFAQPPATGTVRGPVDQVGVEGAELRFPEISLRLPSLRLPAFSRFRQEARMDIDSARAPYTPSAPIAAMPLAAAPVAAAPLMSQAAPQFVPQAPAIQYQPQVAAAPQQQMSIPLNLTVAPPPAHQIELTPEDLRELLRQMEQREPPQAPVETPSCNSDLRREIADMRHQMHQLQQALEQKCNQTLPPSCKAPGMEAAPPAYPRSNYPYQAYPQPESNGAAPWPIPLPDQNSRIARMPATQPVTFQQTIDPSQVAPQPGPAGTVIHEPRHSRTNRQPRASVKGFRPH